MSISVVAFDESGNTGQNLLDPEQPIFALASVCLTQAEITELTSSITSVAHNEMHFTLLSAKIIQASVCQRATFR